MHDLFSQRLLLTVLSVLGATILFLLLGDRSDNGTVQRPPWTIWALGAYLIAIEFIDAGIAPFVQPQSWFLQNTYGLGWVLVAVYPLIPVLLFLYLTGSNLKDVRIGVHCLSSNNIVRGVKWGFCWLCVAMFFGFLDPEEVRLSFEKFGDSSGAQIHKSISGMTVEFLKMVIGLIVVSFAEEMTYRGMLYRTLRGRMAPWLATLVSAWCFMVPHGIMNLPLFVTACGNAILLEKYGSLGPAVLVHAIWNIGLLTTGWCLITLQFNAQTVFGVGFLVTLLVWLYAWATLRIHDYQSRIALR